MGLDMYLYAAKKPNLLQDKIYNRAELTDYFIFNKDEISGSICSDLQNFSQSVKVTTQYIDVEKIANENGFTTGYLSMRSGDVYGFALRKEENQQHYIELSEDAITANYIIEKTEVQFVTSLRELFYWRKAYDVQDIFYDLIPNIENLGYYNVDIEFINQNRKRLKINNRIYIDDDEGCSITNGIRILNNQSRLLLTSRSHLLERRFYETI